MSPALHEKKKKNSSSRGSKRQKQFVDFPGVVSGDIEEIRLKTIYNLEYCGKFYIGSTTLVGILLL